LPVLLLLIAVVNFFHAWSAILKEFMFPLWKLCFEFAALCTQFAEGNWRWKYCWSAMHCGIWQRWAM
jgi:hypothetical protein